MVSHSEFADDNLKNDWDVVMTAEKVHLLHCNIASDSLKRDKVIVSVAAWEIPVRSQDGTRVFT
jgi:hypothetical protein